MITYRGYTKLMTVVVVVFADILSLHVPFVSGDTQCLPEVSNKKKLETPAIKFDFDVVLGLCN